MRRIQNLRRVRRTTQPLQNKKSKASGVQETHELRHSQKKKLSNNHQDNRAENQQQQSQEHKPNLSGDRNHQETRCRVANIKETWTTIVSEELSAYNTKKQNTTTLRTLIRHSLSTLIYSLTTCLVLLLLRMTTEYLSDKTPSTDQEFEPQTAIDINDEMSPYDEEPPSGRDPETASRRQSRNYAGTQEEIAKSLARMAEALFHINKEPHHMYNPNLPAYPANSVPTFDGNNVTSFLEEYENMTKYYNFTDQMRIERLTAHCSERQRHIIQASDEYSKACIDFKWSDLRASLRDLFRTNDRYQQEERAEYFEHWLAECQKREGLSIPDYLQDFKIRSKRCIEAGTIEEDRRGFYLVKGLPLRHATKILEKFGYESSKPRTFNYKKIHDNLVKRYKVEEEAKMLNPSEAIKEFHPDVEFKASSQDQPAKAPQATTVPMFRPGILQVPDIPKPMKTHQPKQSPPGAAPTQNEINDLVEKMMELKINSANYQQAPWTLSWTPRESELMNNQVVNAEVRKRTDERSRSLQGYLYENNRQQDAPSNVQPNYSDNTQSQSNQQIPPRPRSSQGYGQSFNNSSQGFSQGQNQNRLPGQCWGCGSLGHTVRGDPTIRELIRLGWCHFDGQDGRGQLTWGTPENPRGRIVGLSQGEWIPFIVSEIKRRWLRRDVDPLKMNAEWGPTAPQGQLPTTQPSSTNAISVQFLPDSAGAIENNNLQSFWNLTDRLTSYTDRTNPAQHLHEVSSTTMSQGSDLKAPRANHAKTILKKPSVDRIPHLRGHKNRDDHFFDNRQPPRDNAVQWANPVTPSDFEMIDAPENKAEKRSRTPRSSPPPEAKERHPRKHKLVEKLDPDAQKVVQYILDADVTMPLKTVIGNMPEVKKKLFLTGYSQEEFEKLAVNSLHQHLAEAASESEEEDYYQPTMSAQTNSVEVKMPDYVFIEAENGRISHCTHLSADHWNDPQISQVEQYIPLAEEEEEDKPRTHQEYDRPAGVEHLRRDCPKVPIDIRGTGFLSLIDSGAELNTMKRETAERAMLPITTLPASMRTAKMVTANGTTEGFGGIVWGVPVRIGADYSWKPIPDGCSGADRIRH